MTSLAMTSLALALAMSSATALASASASSSVCVTQPVMMSRSAEAATSKTMDREAREKMAREETEARETTARETRGEGTATGTDETRDEARRLLDAAIERLNLGFRLPYPISRPPVDRAVRIYSDGVFDLFHLGHMRQLEQAKTAFPNTYLLVGLPDDAETHRRKGLTVMTDREREQTLRHCRWVDEVIPKCPWIITPSFLAQHAIDYVAHDDLPYPEAGGSADIYAEIKAMGKFLPTRRTEGISSSDLVARVYRFCLELRSKTDKRPSEQARVEQLEALEQQWASLESAKGSS